MEDLKHTRTREEQAFAVAVVLWVVLAGVCVVAANVLASTLS